MIVMEFEELQKIWDEQRGEQLYAINEDALHRRVKSKKKAANRLINLVELSLMTINSSVAVYLLYDAITDQEGIWDYALSGIMFLTVIFLIGFRYKRKKSEGKFDRSMVGELDHAIANTTSGLQIATIMIYYYLIPLGLFVLSKMAYFGASIEKWLLIIGMFILSYFLIQWDRKRFYMPRKANLEKLKETLIREE